MLPAPARAQTCAPTDADYKLFEGALAAANEALDKLETANEPLVKDTKDISEALKKVNINEAMVGQFEKVADTLKKGVSTAEGRLAATKGPAEELRKKVNELGAAFVPFSGCAGTSDAKAKVVLDKRKEFLDGVEEQGKVEGALAEAVQGIPDSVEEFLDGVAEKAPRRRERREAGHDDSSLRSGGSAPGAGDGHDHAPPLREGRRRPERRARPQVPRH